MRFLYVYKLIIELNFMRFFFFSQRKNKASEQKRDNGTSLFSFRSVHEYHRYVFREYIFRNNFQWRTEQEKANSDKKSDL